MDETVCCICFEGALPNNTLGLIACGCRVGWFHNHCLHQWIDMTRQYPYQCPGCRRAVPMKTNYSFHYLGGEDQQFLWITLGAFVLEVLTSLWFLKSTKYWYIFPTQTAAILLHPFMIPVGNYYTHYLFHTRLRYYFLLLEFVILANQSISLQQKVEYLTFPGYIHIFTLWLVSILEVQNRGHYLILDIFEPFAISREIQIKDTLVAETPSDAREGHEGTRGAVAQRRRARGKRS